MSLVLNFSTVTGDSKRRCAIRDADTTISSSSVEEAPSVMLKA